MNETRVIKYRPIFEEEGLTKESFNLSLDWECLDIMEVNERYFLITSETYDPRLTMTVTFVALQFGQSIPRGANFIKTVKRYEDSEIFCIFTL